MESLIALAILGFWITVAMTLGGILLYLIFAAFALLFTAVVWAFNKLTGKEKQHIVGTRIGGLKTREKILARDPNHYKKIGSKGGHNGNTGGFAANPELAREAGRKAGTRSKRGHKFIEAKNGYYYYIALDTGKVVKYKHEEIGVSESCIGRLINGKTYSGSISRRGKKRV